LQGAYVIPASVKKINDSAFFDCTGLTSVVIPASVTDIGKVGFENFRANIMAHPDNWDVKNLSSFENKFVPNSQSPYFFEAPLVAGMYF